MDIKEFENYTNNLDAYTIQEVKDMTPMTSDEFESYQCELDYDTGNLSNWDHARAIVTLKKMIIEKGR